jgi:hypothetical protein
VLGRPVAREDAVFVFEENGRGGYVLRLHE